MVNKMAQGCGLKLAVLYEKYKMETDFRFAAHAVLPQSRGREGGGGGGWKRDTEILPPLYHNNYNYINVRACTIHVQCTVHVYTCM